MNERVFPEKQFIFYFLYGRARVPYTDSYSCRTLTRNRQTRNGQCFVQSIGHDRRSSNRSCCYCGHRRPSSRSYNIPTNKCSSGANSCLHTWSSPSSDALLATPSRCDLDHDRQYLPTYGIHLRSTLSFSTIAGASTKTCQRFSEQGEGK
jgi:hypothetical protein